MLFSFIFIEKRRKEHRSLHKCSCIACNKMMTRNNLLIFIRSDYDFNSEFVQKTFNKETFISANTIRYICKQCHKQLRYRPGKEPHLPTKSMKEDVKAEYICTCCHKQTTMRHSVILYDSKKYDFDNECVKMCLNEKIRCRRSLYEYICTQCHSYLKKKEFQVPSIPPNAYARKLNKDQLCKMSNYKNKSKVGLMGNQKQKTNNSSRQVNWDRILQQMEKCTNFNELSEYVSHLDIAPIASMKGTQLLDGYQRDVLATSLLPDDCGIATDSLFPILTTGDGNCLMYSLSRLVYGNELHGTEMRVRIIEEGVRNIHLYLDHSYLCRGYSFPYGRQNNLARVYCTMLA